MPTMMEERLQGVAYLLLQACILKKENIIEYHRLATLNQQSLLQYLVTNHLVDGAILAPLIARHFSLPLLDLDGIKSTALPLAFISEKLIQQHNLIPLFQKGKQLYVATDDPSQSSSLKDIQFHTGLSIYPVVVETEKLRLLINTLLHQKEQQGLFDYFKQQHITNSIDINHGVINKNTISTEDTPVVKFIYRVLIEAIHQGVSDIHFEPYENEYRIRYRQDGLLRAIAAPPPGLSARIAARLKIMSALDISERRIPQDGRFQMTLSLSCNIDIRVSTCPTIAGEKLVLRILDPKATQLGIEALGFNALQERQFMHAICRPQGLILVTGPTGSGKTVTLYTALNYLNTVEKNISTAEDPVEIKLNGINQVQVNPKTGLTFANSLRAFLRQDPDIIMIGEVRDLETAEIAVKAAQTGHLVLSTVHTNSAAETLDRLLNMGVPSFNIASGISLIIAQRLVRKLCEHCKIIRDDKTPEHFISAKNLNYESHVFQSFKAVGCDQCTDGYRGRVGVFELMPISASISHLILSGATSLDTLKHAQLEGMLTMYQSGLEKVKQGITTLEEVNRVTVD